MTKLEQFLRSLVATANLSIQHARTVFAVLQEAKPGRGDQILVQAHLVILPKLVDGLESL